MVSVEIISEEDDLITVLFKDADRAMKGLYIQHNLAKNSDDSVLHAPSSCIIILVAATDTSWMAPTPCASLFIFIS